MTLTRCWRISLLTAVLSAVFFYSKEISFDDYILFAYLILAFLLFSYRFFCCNKNIVRLAASIYIPNLIIYLSFKSINYSIAFDSTDIIYITFCVLLIIPLLIYVAKGLYSKYKDEKKYENYFPARELELEYLAELLSRKNVVGINSDWGYGKSFLVKLFAQKYKVRGMSKTGYHVITISVMSATVETIESFIVSEIESFLDSHLIFSYSSQKIKKFFTQPLLKSWSFVFDDKNSYTRLIESLVDDVKGLGIKIVLSFEDLERINDPRIIQKIFCISEQINNDYIKIVFQYDEGKLFKILGTTDKNYLEKYIPYSINLRTILFNEVVEACIEHRKKENDAYKHLTIYDLDRLFQGVNSGPFFENSGIYYHLNIPAVNIRKITIFLNEIDELLNIDIFSSHKQIVITYCVVKYFYPEIFSEIKSDQSLLSSLLFEIVENDKEKYYNILKCIHLVNDGKIKKEDLIKNNKNLDRLIVLGMLEYSFEHISDKLDPESWIEGRERNETIDSIVWKLLNIGYSGLTEKQNLLKKIEHILDESDVHRESAQLELLLLTDEDVKRQVPGAFRGTSIEYITFLFSLLEDRFDVWKKWIDLVIEHFSIEYINETLFALFIRFKISSKSILLYAIEKFNSLDVKFNYNDKLKYLDFLRAYLWQIKNIGYFNQINLDTNVLRNPQAMPVEEFFNLPNEKKEEKDSLTKVLSDILGEIRNRSNHLKTVLSIAAEYKVIINFIEKNLDLIKAPAAEFEKKEQDDDFEDVLKNSEEAEYEPYLKFQKEKDVDELLSNEYKAGKKTIEDVRLIKDRWMKKYSAEKDNPT